MTVRWAILLVLLSACVIEPTTSPDGSVAPQSGSEVAATTQFLDPEPPNTGTPASVTFVSDGDSFVVEIDGSEERVRMIGINTPEKEECFGSEARDVLIALIADREVLLVPDVETFDQFGRMLSYVYLDGVLINAEMARQGAALTRGYSPNTTLQDHLSSAQDQAEREGVGLWGACVGDGDPDVLILSVQADAPGRDNENLNGEFIIVENQSTTSIEMSGWTIRDESSVHRFVFPSGASIDPGAFFVVLTGCGTSSSDEFYWCNSSPVWDNSGDTAFLLDLDGNIHHRFSY